MIIFGVSDPDELAEMAVDVPGRDDEVSLRVKEVRSKSAGWKCLWMEDGWNQWELDSDGGGKPDEGPAWDGDWVEE